MLGGEPRDVQVGLVPSLESLVWKPSSHLTKPGIHKAVWQKNGSLGASDNTITASSIPPALPTAFAWSIMSQNTPERLNMEVAHKVQQRLYPAKDDPAGSPLLEQTGSSKPPRNAHLKGKYNLHWPCPCLFCLYLPQVAQHQLPGWDKPEKRKL